MDADIVVTFLMQQVLLAMLCFLFYQSFATSELNGADCC